MWSDHSGIHRLSTASHLMRSDKRRINLEEETIWRHFKESCSERRRVRCSGKFFTQKLLFSSRNNLTTILIVTILRLELQRHGYWKDFLDYRTCIQKVVKHSLRITFLEECCKAEIIPRFLKFRIPNNGCFDDKSVHDFQKWLLKKELQMGEWI